MSHQYQPTEHTKRREILNAIKRVDCLSDLLSATDDHLDHEVDLEVIVYGRGYKGRPVGPYVRLLSYEAGQTIIKQGEWAGNVFYIVVDGGVDVFIKKHPVDVERRITALPAGEQFGARSMLFSGRRQATVKAPEDRASLILEVQRPAIRLLRKLPKFADKIDEINRDHGMETAIDDLISKAGISREFREELKGLSAFKAFSKDHVLFVEGSSISQLFIITEGWVCRSKQTPRGEIRDSLGKGYCLGLEGIIQNANYPYTGTLMARTEVLEINIIRLRQAGNLKTGLIPMLEQFSPAELRQAGRLKTGLIPTLEQFSPAEMHSKRAAYEPVVRERVLGTPEINIIQLRQDLKAALVPALKEFAPPEIHQKVATYEPVVRDRILASQEALINKGLVDATNLLVMDMDLCVRCGNCSMACHKVHGQSRLMRQGIHITRLEPLQQKHFQSLLAPAACMHCKNPECLTGCPTGAIARLPGGQIDIDRGTCIGCGDCATQCPYDAIFMVNRDEAPPPPRTSVKTRLWRGLVGSAEPDAQLVDPARDLLAVKCNLCSDRTTLNPPRSKTQAYSCEENCPTGALTRIIPDEYFSEIAQIENLRMLDSGHAFGRNIHKSDFTKRWIHATCTLLFILTAALTVAGLQRYGYGQRVWGFFNMRWITGLGGLVAIVAAAAYQWRRKIYHKRRWPLRYWMLVHSYLGVIACFIILLHGRTSSGGWLTKTLMMSFDLVIVTGLFGLICYQIIPRLLTRIEGTPLLIEDLKTRRDELQRELSDIIIRSPEPLGSLIKERLVRRFDRITVTLRQVLKPESLESLLWSAKKEFRATAEELDEREDRLLFDQAVRAATLLPRVRALVYLHRLLKVWLAPHIASVCFMLALLIVHIIQVIYASW